MFKHDFKPLKVEERLDQLRAALKTERDPIRMQEHTGELQVALSERAEIASQRLERQTCWLIILTVILSILTLALLVFTIYLYKDSHFKTQTNQTGSPSIVEHP
jgi:hypothetical protein